MKDAFEELEFNKIKALIKNFCTSNLGKKSADQLKTLTNKSEIENRISELHDTVEFLSPLPWGQKNNFNLTGLRDTEFLFPKLKHDDYFTVEEFLLFACNIKIANNLRKNEAVKKQNFPYLFSIVNNIVITAGLEKEFDRTFEPNGEIKDGASENLTRIRKKQVRFKKRIYTQLQEILSQKQYEKVIQDKIVTIREERYVIPVKAGGESIIKGFVHSRSQSGASVFLEPLSVFETNNSLINLADEEKQEIQKILIKLFLSLKKHSEILYQNLKILQKVDFLNAAAKYCISIKATVPTIQIKPIIKLTNARHPLLYLTMKEEEIVPFSLNLGNEFRSLIISGVNTGGKTVTLKALGLLSMMALSGLMIPSEEAEIGIFENFLTDINDEQSIENSISTFSSHIAKIRIILKKANEKCLVLIDELGSGTDPEEGAALAQSVLEKLVSQKAKIVITTHLNKLKLFASEHPLCENACMRFDQKNLVPTYQLDVGFPGNSYALDIAREYKLDTEVVARARKLIDQKSQQLSHLLKKTEQQRTVLMQKINEYNLKNSIVELTLKSLQEKEKNWKNIEREKKLKTIQKGEEYLINLQQKFEQELSEFKTKFKKEKKIESKDVKKISTKIQKEKEKLGKQKEELSEIKLIPEKNPKINDIVLIKSLNLVGKIIRIKKSSIKIKADGIIYSTSKKDIFKIPEGQKKNQRAKNSKKFVSVHSEISYDFPFELNVIGFSFEEARPEIDKYIDKAILFDLDKVQIVHGKGTGELRKKIWNYLKSDTRISDYFSPPEQEGGIGVTVGVIK